jgi:hypothetical protein
MSFNVQLIVLRIIQLIFAEIMKNKIYMKIKIQTMQNVKAKRNCKVRHRVRSY